jgi:hypothetical protein
MTYEQWWMDTRVLQGVMEIWAQLKSVTQVSRELGLPEEYLPGLMEWLDQQSQTADGVTGSVSKYVDERLGPGEFLQLLRMHFAYLFTEYGFDVVMDDEHRSVQDWHVIVQSTTTRVRFVLASHEEYVDINLNPLPNPEAPPLWLQAYDSSSIDLMDIVGWRTESDRILTYALPSDAGMGTADSIKLQMAQLSQTLREYAEPFLRGDFSCLSKVKSYRDHLVFGGKEN